MATLPLLKPGENLDLWLSRAKVHLPSVAAKDLFAAFPGCPFVEADAVLAAHCCAGIPDDHLRRKLIKKQALASDQLLSLVQDYEGRYGPSLTTPCFATSLLQRKETRSAAIRSVATQTYRNFTRPPRGSRAPVSKI
ncbi:unnamed protein product [Dibothriocephalus latus]|uniref:Uncharacterized protein n=1 Tax=Dibothriocephalus latus TaxID=60516 RepID=A0A3P7LYG6_DIBLA|nr:unnamed protein product [Dibothriocephalus latus]